MPPATKRLELGDILGSMSHAHEQPTPALQWVIDHGFGLPETPTVMAYDATDLYIAPQSVSNPSEDRTVLTFASTMAGLRTARLVGKEGVRAAASEQVAVAAYQTALATIRYIRSQVSS